MRAAVALTLLLLAGCARGGETGSVQAACAREADNSPPVQEMVRIGASAQHYAWENGPRLQQARQDATLACLRSRGLAPKGGVERPRS